jgi:hypothetical protein
MTLVLCLVAGSHQSGNIFERVKTTQGVFYVVLGCFILLFIWRIPIEFTQRHCGLDSVNGYCTLSGAPGS